MGASTAVVGNSYQAAKAVRGQSSTSVFLSLRHDQPGGRGGRGRQLCSSRYVGPAQWNSVGVQLDYVPAVAG